MSFQKCMQEFLFAQEGPLVLKPIVWDCETVYSAWKAQTIANKMKPRTQKYKNFEKYSWKKLSRIRETLKKNKQNTRRYFLDESDDQRDKKCYCYDGRTTFMENRNKKKLLGMFSTKSIPRFQHYVKIST